MGDTGPCGPCSEIHYDRGPDACDMQDVPGHTCEVNGDCARFTEIWNLVFIQYDRHADGSLDSLPERHVDTGLGFERLVSLLEGKSSNYRTDLFWPLIQRVQQMTNQTDEEREDHIVAYRVIADHIRAVTFLIGDGVMPANDGRGYVLRMILRRAVRFGRTLGFHEPFLRDLADLVVEIMGDAFPELPNRLPFIKSTIQAEETRFLRTLDQGLLELEEVIERVKARDETVIPGERAFYLHDTLGLPIEVTRDIAEEAGLTVDEAGYRAAREEQRARGRASATFELQDDEHAQLYPRLQAWIDTQAPDRTLTYDPYHAMQVEAEVVGMLHDEDIVTSASEGDDVEIVLDTTCFYVASGGQVSDTGWITGSDWAVEVTDVKQPIEQLVVHIGRVTKGTIEVGDGATAHVDETRRWDIMRNHTATHLLHRALRETLGDHVRQAGSVVAPDRLRFDFNNNTPMTADQRATIERIVTEAVLANYPVVSRQESYRDALDQGVIALFEEKYGDVVRVLRVGDAEAPFSQELCGGTHVTRTGDIGPFMILSETGIGAGIRRVEAVTGRGALEAVHAQRARQEKTAALLGSPVEEVPNRVERLQEELREAQREVDRLTTKLARADFQTVLDDVQEVEGIPVLAAQVDAPDAGTLREMADWFRDKMQGGVIVLGTIANGNPLLIAATTQALVDQRGIHAGNLIRQVAQMVDGGGGGRPDMAQAGGRSPEKLPAALERVPSLIEAMIKD
jgi:alanyl-tRNA synthetase